MSCLTCGTWTDMDVGGGTGWDDATPLARGVPCLEARRRFNSQLDGDESAKGFWVASYTSARQAAGPGSADTLTARLKRPGFRKPGFCGTDWGWRLLILIGSRANRKAGTPLDGCGALVRGLGVERPGGRGRGLCRVVRRC